MSRSSPRSSRCIWNSFRSVEAIADAKAEIFQGIEPGGAAVINRDNPHFARLQKQAQGRGRRPHRLVRRERQGRCAADQVRAAAGLVDRAGAHPRRRRHLQARRAGPPCRAEFARRAGGGVARRRRSRARGAGAGESRRRRAAAAASGIDAGSARRHGAADRRELQRQSGLDAGGAGAARPGAGRAARPAHRRAGRDAGAWRPRRGAASRAGRADRGQFGRSRVLRGPALPGASGRPFPPNAGAAMP